MKNQAVASELALSMDTLLSHWLEHRRLTRRVINAFPEDKLYTYSIGGMRPFAQLAMELIGIALPGIHGMATGKWTAPGYPDLTTNTPPPATRAELLKLWDAATEEISKMWPQISPERLQETDKAFGAYEGKVSWHYFYFVDNEIHHRAQGYVYLRSLGIEPPAFWDRS